MKKVFQKLFSTTMALMLLLSTVSWTVDKHLCMGRVIDVAFFTKADDCGMKTALAVLEDDAIKNHCCADETFVIVGQDDLKLSSNNFDFGPQVFFTVFAISFTNHYKGSVTHTIPNEYYPPPLIIKDRVVLHEVFLI